MLDSVNKTLIYAIGNPARGDDGFGPAVLKALKKENLSAIDYQINYQLNIEDAELFSHYQMVIIIDASLNPGGLKLSKLQAENTDPHSTHALTPSQVLALSQSLFQFNNSCWLLTTTGTQWDLGNKLSENVRMDIDPACKLITELVKKEQAS